MRGEEREANMLAFRAPSGLDTSSSWCFWVVVALVLALVLHAHTRPLNRNIDGMPSSMASASSNTCPSNLIWRTTFACPPILRYCPHARLSVGRNTCGMCSTKITPCF